MPNPSARKTGNPIPAECDSAKGRKHQEACGTHTRERGHEPSLDRALRRLGDR